MMNEYLNQRNVFPKLNGTYKFLKAQRLVGSTYAIKKDDEHRRPLGQVERGRKLRMTKGLGSEERWSFSSSDFVSSGEII